MQPNGSHETALGERWLATSEVVWENVDLDRREIRVRTQRRRVRGEV
ncbi:hypothetical protein SAMN02745898_104336 [Streptomyces sp. 136MFCol5.1]|nr:hypothetical protein SAMN02745898_104336 [Streptomyces sp. 136MFCol5.1]